ncbi:hypothetical protein QTP86_026081 [Hemibagrus guttatus]|nr:hypothetical protein QTP86_026081 [Hemibagrus guttatus]
MQDLSWSCHINTVVKKARQHLYHLRCLRDFRLPSKVLRNFYSCTIESILTGNITTWFGNSTMQDRRALQKVVQSAERIIRIKLPDLHSIYSKRCWTKAKKIVKDLSHPNNGLFSLLRSGKRFHSLKANTERLRRSFFPQEIQTLNQNWTFMFPSHMSLFYTYFLFALFPSSFYFLLPIYSLLLIPFPRCKVLSSSHSSPSLFSNCYNFTSHRRRRSNSEGCGHEMIMKKSWSLIGHCVNSSSTPCKITVPAPLDYSAESWSAIVGFEFSHTLDRKTVKRQEVIYELMQTEFHHVQTLTVMNDVLRRGLLKEVQLEQNVVGQIFPCLDDLLMLHRNFLSEMEIRQCSSTHLSNGKNFIIYRIGDILLQQFSGPSAGHMMTLYGDFCSKQSEALKIYKQLQQSNRKLQLFLRQLSSNSVIKRREIPEFLLLITQRITKYPILLERLMQHTNGTIHTWAGVEHDDVMAALEGVRFVLSGVELHVEKIQRAQELEDIINRMDNKSFTRLKSGKIYSKHTLSHTPHTLTHSATLTCRTTSGRLRDVFALLLSDVLVFLQEKEQKFTFAALEQKPAVVPLRALILREIANQDRGLFLISSDATEPEMYEIHTHNREERDRWITLLQHTTDSLPDNELKNNDELKCKNMKSLQVEALLSLDVQVYAVLEEKLRVCVGTLTHQHLLIQTHTHTPSGSTLLTAAQAEVVNLLVCMTSLLFGYHNFIQHVEELSKKCLKQKEPLILKVVDCVRSLTQILYSLQAAVMMQDSVYEVQKLLIVEEETLLADTDRKVGDRRLCQWNVEQRDSDHSEEMDRMKTEKEELEVQLQQWAERSQALRKEEVGVEQERRRIQQDEKRIRKERERMQRKLHLSQLNSTNRQRSLSIIPLDK